MTSSHLYPRRRDIVRFENLTRLPFLRGSQRPWRGRSYSPSELCYMPNHIMPCPRRSQSHSPSASRRRRTPVMGTQMAQSQSHTRSRLGSRSASCSPPPWHPTTPAPMSQGILRPSSHSAFTPVGHRSPSPSPFYRRKLFFMTCAMNSALWETCTLLLRPWAFPICGLTNS